MTSSVNPFDRPTTIDMRDEDKLHELRRVNYELKKQLNRLSPNANIPNPNPDTFQHTSNPIKKPHYYTTVADQNQLLQQEKKIQDFQTVILRQQELMRVYQAQIKHIEKNMQNVQKIDADIYGRLSDNSFTQKALVEAKDAIRKGESRDYIKNILSRIP